MRLARLRVLFVSSLLIAVVSAQTSPNSKSNSSSESKPAEDYSGMYAFLQEGEFIQLTVEDDGRVTGIVSRFEGDPEKGAFLDQFFKQGKLEGKKLSFTTQTVHGVWYEFKGAVEHGAGKNEGDEAYYVLKGMLIQNSWDVNHKVTSKTTDVAFKSFPRDLENEPAK